MHDEAYPLLLIDAGNSRIKWQFRELRAAAPVKGALPTSWMQSDGTVDGTIAHGLTELTAQQDPGDGRLLSAISAPKSIWISNVAGADVAAALATWLGQQWPRARRHTVHAAAATCGVTNHYQKPESLGSDRWAGMIGARAAYPNEALLIATVGTATTLDAMNADGHFVGGLIAPGWALMMRSLGESTAQLPVLAQDDARSVPRAKSLGVFAQATPEAIIEGCRLAQAGMIASAWLQWQNALNLPVRCLLAGGAAEDISPALTIPHTRHDGLVLEGLERIATQPP